MNNTDKEMKFFNEIAKALGFKDSQEWCEYAMKRYSKTILDYSRK